MLKESEENVLLDIRIYLLKIQCLKVLFLKDISMHVFDIETLPLTFPSAQGEMSPVDCWLSQDYLR